MVADDGAGVPKDAEGAPDEPCLARPGVTARQADTVCEAEAVITITDSLLPEATERAANRQGLPGYTLEHAPGKLWRSRYDAERNLIVVNSGPATSSSLRARRR
jgi:hypothetical protein